MRTTFMLGLTNGGRELDGSPACVGKDAVAANLSVSGADGDVDSAKVIPPVHATTSKTDNPRATRDGVKVSLAYFAAAG
jgi:hypothetical protein